LAKFSSAVGIILSLAQAFANGISLWIKNDILDQISNLKLPVIDIPKK
jgi:hypothetical protein